MPTTYKVLGQVLPSATTATTLYTVPADTATVVSTIKVANQGVSTTFRIAVRVAGAALEEKQYVVWDAPLTANDSISFTEGLTLAATDVLTVYAGTANLSFNVFGSELS